jgi:hypothetical protein
MSDYKTFFLHGKEFRYYNDDRIEREFRNIKNYWRPIAIAKCNKIYKHIQFVIDGKQYSFKLHRVIYFVNNPDWNIYDEKQEIDHINHPKGILSLDNSITNLRCSSHRQNMFNKNTNKCSWNKQRNKWRARIGVDGMNVFLGYFVEKQDAEDAYQKAKLIYHFL